MDKYNGKENKLWRKKTTNFLSSKMPDAHPLLLWAERQKDAITDEKLAAGCFGDPLLAKAQLTLDYASVISFHLWGFLNTRSSTMRGTYSTVRICGLAWRCGASSTSRSPSSRRQRS